MQILGQVTLQRAVRRHADVANALATWSATVMAAKWTSFAQVKADFPAADYVRPFTVFNVKGNKYRLITVVDYAGRNVVVRDVLTHALYSKGTWK